MLVVQNGMQCVCADARRCDRAGFERNNDREGLLFLVVSTTRTIAYDAYLKRVCKPLLDGKGQNINSDSLYLWVLRERSLQDG